MHASGRTNSGHGPSSPLFTTVHAHAPPTPIQSGGAHSARRVSMAHLLLSDIQRE